MLVNSKECVGLKADKLSENHVERVANDPIVIKLIDYDSVSTWWKEEAADQQLKDQSHSKTWIVPYRSIVRLMILDPS